MGLTKSIFIQCKIGTNSPRKRTDKGISFLSLGPWAAVTSLEPEKPWIQKSPLLWEGISSAGHACKTNPLLSDVRNPGNKTAISRSRRVSLYLNQAACNEKTLIFLPRKAQKRSHLGLYISWHSPLLQSGATFPRTATLGNDGDLPEGVNS